MTNLVNLLVSNHINAFKDKIAVLCETRVECEEFKRLYYDEMFRFRFVHDEQSICGYQFQKIIKFGS